MYFQVFRGSGSDWVSAMRSVNQMHPKALAAIGAACCGPANGVWDPDRRYWVCDYHEGYSNGLEDCEEEWSA